MAYVIERHINNKSYYLKKAHYMNVPEKRNLMVEWTTQPFNALQRNHPDTIQLDYDLIGHRGVIQEVTGTEWVTYNDTMLWC